MAMFGGAPKASPQQAVKIPAPAPVRDDVGDTAAEQRARLAGLRGRGATLLGAPGAYAAGTDQKRVLLGVDA